MKATKAAIGSAQANNDKIVKKLKPRAKAKADEQGAAFVKMAGSVDNAINQLAVMMLQQQAQAETMAAELRAENKLLKEGFAVMQHEMKALRERAVRLKPVQNADGSYKHIDVIPLQKRSTTH